MPKNKHIQTKIKVMQDYIEFMKSGQSKKINAYIPYKHVVPEQDKPIPQEIQENPNTNL
jgi:hypothetical protein